VKTGDDVCRLPVTPDTEESTVKAIKIQPEIVTDNIWVDHHAGPGQSPLIFGERQPYPFLVTEDGFVLDQDFWRGDPERIVGFQNDEEIQRIDVWWSDVVKDPELAVGKFPVMVEKGQGLYTYTVAVESAEAVEVSSC
jgi:hypothetical protein